MNRRPDLVVLLPWLALAAVELLIAGQALARPSARQVAVEVAGLAVMGASQARFAPTGPWRSPLVPGVAAVGLTVGALAPGAGLVKLATWVGLATLGALLVGRVERSRPAGLVAGLVAAVLGAAGARTAVLHRAASEGTAGADPWTAPWRELATSLRPVSVGGDPDLKAAAGPPVLLITVDTLRADAGARMTAFARVGAGGARWPRARASSSWTVPSVGSVLTGLSPADHGAGVAATGALQGLRADVPTLAEALAAEGYATAAFVTNAWLASGLGFERGFHTWRHADVAFAHRLLLAGFPDGPAGHQADAVVDAALRWLDHAPDRGAFLWVHLVDPHLPYLHADAPPAAGLTDERLRAGLRLTPALQEAVRAAYQHEVDVTDAALGRLLDAVEARGWLDQGLVALTADHGEELWDHGGTGHGHTHHAEVVEVPLALNLRRTPAPDEGLATLADVPTTLARGAGVTLGRGHDLRAPVPAGRLVTTQGNAFFWQGASATDGVLTAVRARSGAAPVCFSWADRAEREAVACSAGVIAGVEGVREVEGGEGVEVDRRALEALGYVE